MPTKKITDDSFDADVTQSNQPVLVDFWAEWCGPCKAVGPVLEELSAEFDGKVTIGKMNIDENPNTPGQFRVRSIPTMMLFKNGEVVDTQVGALSKADLATWLNSKVA